MSEIRKYIQYNFFDVFDVFAFSILSVFLFRVKLRKFIILLWNIYAIFAKKKAMSLINLISNTFQMKCPKCREGELFESSSFSFNSKSFYMPDSCPVCEQNYMPEPGFYYGAMFLSYILTGTFSIIFMFIVHWYFGLTLMTSFGILVLVLGLFFVFVFRIARSLWINIMVSYDPERKKKRS